MGVDAGEVQARMTMDTGSYLRDLKAASRETSRAGRAMRVSLAGISGGLATFGLAVQGLRELKNAAGALVGAFAGPAGETQTFVTSLETLLGTEERALAMHKELLEFARQTPFELPGLRRSTRLLLAFGFEAESVIPLLRTIGDAVGSLGIGEEGLNRVVRALGQIRTKGKVSAEELLQLAEAGIPAYEILREKLQLTQEEVTNIGNQGITASDALAALQEGLDERFGGGMARQAATLSGVMSNLSDTFYQIRDAVGQLFLPVFKAAASGMVEFGDTILAVLDDTNPKYAEMREELKELAKAVGGVDWSGLAEDMITVSLAIVDITRALAANVKEVADAIFWWKNFGQTLGNVAKAVTEWDAGKAMEEWRAGDLRAWERHFDEITDKTQVFGGQVGGMGLPKVSKALDDIGKSVNAIDTDKIRFDGVTDSADEFGDAMRDATEDARIYMRELGIETEQTSKKIEDIGKKLGEELADLQGRIGIEGGAAYVDAANKIEDAMQRARDATRDVTQEIITMNRNAALEMEQVARQAEQQIASLRDTYMQSLRFQDEDRSIRSRRSQEDLNRRRMFERADMEKRFARRRRQIEADAEREMAGAFTSEEQHAIREKLRQRLAALDEEKAQAEDDMLERRKREDEERKIREQRDIEDLNRRRARERAALNERIAAIKLEAEERKKRIEEERKQKELELEQELLDIETRKQAEIQAVVDLRDEKLRQLQLELAERTAELEQAAKEDVRREEQRAQDMADAFKRKYFDRLRDEARAAAAAVQGQLFGAIDASLSKLAAARDQASSYASMGSGLPLRLAEGGIALNPTFALIGEAGPEAVIPLDKLMDVVPRGSDDKDTGTQVTINRLEVQVKSTGSSPRDDGRQAGDGFVDALRRKGVAIAGAR